MSEGMTVLLLGSGGREHALAWKMAQSPLVSKIAVLPGNEGMAGVECVAGDALEVAQNLKADLIVVGPEKPMADGTTDKLARAGFKVMGPSQAAAQLESSKIFSKNFMVAEGIATAKAQTCENYEAAVAALAAWDVENSGIVIKADGLAAGKGVVVTQSREEAEKTLYDFMRDPVCTVKADRVLLEEVLKGREVSAFAVCDGETFIPLGYICDYKRVFDGNKGPNTGGMGCYSPKDWPSDTARHFVNERVFARVVAGMKKRGTPFRGVLFAGLMVDGDDVKVIEFNVRFGDPETQTLMPLLADDIVPLFLAAAEGRLAGQKPPALSGQASVHVVMTSKGYPDVGGAGMLLDQQISFPPDADESVHLFFAGVKRVNGVLANAGGRVMGVTATASTLKAARAKAYARVENVSFNGAHWRRDIGE